MPTRLLIANRGEIACRIIKTARRLGLPTVAIFSDADRNAQHVRLADESTYVGPSPPSESYLNQTAIIEAALATGADSVHPGYGFLSESASFASACAEAGLKFLGPSAAAISAMGDKARAKTLMSEAGVPVVPGYLGDEQSPAALSGAAKEIGFPVLVKASAGGGGKGMRVVTNEGELAEQLAAAAREAKAAFGDDRLILERYLQQPRHIEVQVLADQHGNCCHFRERDCSMQRRHQKVVEEAPAPWLDASLREALLEAAVRAAKAIDYCGAGTVEFIVEGDEFFFMEMNTRLQVEHPVTEMICGIDLVEWQIKVAAGESIESIAKNQRAVGHAIEARLYAEDPRAGYLPSIGILNRLRFPEENGAVRIDAGVVGGDEVTVHYDPMLAKIIAHGSNRQEAITTLSAALAETEVLGVATNLGLLRRALDHPEFQTQAITTGFLDQYPELAEPERLGSAPAAAALAELASLDGNGPWQSSDGWRLNAPSHRQLSLSQGQERLDVVIDDETARVNGLLFRVGEFALSDGRFEVDVDGSPVAGSVHRGKGSIELLVHGERYVFRRAELAKASHDGVGSNCLVSPMPGTVLEVRAKIGEQIEKGQVLMVVEAMKMEHRITANAAGVVEEILFREGDRVDEAVELLRISQAKETD